LRSFDNLVQKMTKVSIPHSECKRVIENIEELKDFVGNDITEFIDNFRLLGIPFIEVGKGLITLETNFTPIENQKFCIIDIETNGSKPQNSQIIEIGALIVKSGEVIDRFESFVKADEIPENIVQLTNITLEDIKDAPTLKETLAKFRLFLKDTVFVAHNVNFDYNFISYWLENFCFGPLLNRKICTIDLARKTIKAEKYGLSSLIDDFKIEVPSRHRAYSDALAAKEVFKKSLKEIPSSIITTEDLIRFAKPNPKKRKKKTS